MSKRLDFDQMFSEKPEDLVLVVFGKEYTITTDQDFVKALKAERVVKALAQVDVEGDPELVVPEMMRLQKELALLLLGEDVVTEWYENGMTDSQLLTVMIGVSNALDELRKERQEAANPTKAPSRKKTSK